MESLYSFSRKLAGAGTLDDVLWATAYQTALMLQVRVVLLLPEQRLDRACKAGYPPEDTLDDADLAAATWTWENDRAAGRGSDTLPGAKRLFLPMHTGRGAIGVVGIDSDKAGPLLTPDQRRLLDALMDQGALAIERVLLVEDMDRMERTAETERLRTALLTSISHDLKTPLASVLGSAGTLRDLESKLTDSEKVELLATIIDESERLNRFIANLLDMTRLESGAVAPKLVAARSVGNHRLDLAPDRQNSAASFHPARPRDRRADGVARCRVVRAGAVQSPRQCGEICRRRHDHPDSHLARPGLRFACRSSTRAKAFRRPTSSISSTSSIGCRRPTRFAPAPALGLPSRAASSKRCSGTIVAANRPDRRGAVFTITLADAARAAAAGRRRMSAAPLRVLVVDDEPPIRKLLRMGLAAHGYEVIEAPNGKTALELLGEAPDLVILDLGLPDMQGHELLRTIRARNEAVPVIVLSSRGDEAGKVQALDFGADDYVTKPFGMDELLARIRAALRHQLQTQGERPVFRTGELSVDLVRRIVKVGDKEVKLSPKEYDLLRVLVQHAGKVLTHKFLLGELWDDLTDAQYLRVYVRQLRQKIEADPERPQYVLTETGIGYRLRAPGLRVPK